jgi:hypothetical protein
MKQSREPVSASRSALASASVRGASAAASEISSVSTPFDCAKRCCSDGVRSIEAKRIAVSGGVGTSASVNPSGATVGCSRGA